MGIQNLRVIICMMILVLSLNGILALGISQPYWKNNPLEMYPGETRNIEFTLVNKDSQTATAFVSLTEDAGITEITSGNEYLVEQGTTDTKVVLKISVPESANIGDSYNIVFTVDPAPPEESGTVQIAVGYNVDFPVKVVEKTTVPESSTGEVKDISGIDKSWIIWLLVIIVIIALIIIFIAIKRKR